MNYKIAGGIKNNKKTIIIGLVLWIAIIIVLVLPFTCAKYAAGTSGSFDLDRFFMVYGKALNPGQAFGYIFARGIFGSFISNLCIITLIYSVFFIIGFVRTMPKHQYDNIEHGSSDWSEHGEQYRILSNKEGIILAENNYLPVDKRGNVNVLVVGGSGSGKTASYSIPNAYQKLGSYV